MAPNKMDTFQSIFYPCSHAITHACVYCMPAMYPSSVLGTGGPAVNKTDRNLCSLGVFHSSGVSQIINLKRIVIYSVSLRDHSTEFN